ncbi:MAG: divalent-cation tolerance protein CutA [Planctomycetes bacterium]|nr:divalent-cation tolerance protein CutA [Planctomycetota bacterium]
MSEGLVLLSTAPTEDEARSLAQALVEAGLAACVNLVPGVRSIYRWKGKLCEDGEVLLVIKSTEARREALIERLGALHSYECPEAIALPIVAGSADYLEWLHTTTGGVL